MLTQPDLPLGAASGLLESYGARRLAHEPLNRIIGRSDFFGLDLLVAPQVLDPRSDTETLVELALKRAELPKRPRILDLGSGSGAILCALLTQCPSATGVAVDLSPQACALTVENLAICGLADRSFVIRGHWAEAVAGPFDLVVSNPPYISGAELAELDPEVRQFDPMLALFGGDDGLEPYRAIAPGLPRLLTPRGAVCFEIGWRQGQDVVAILKRAGLIEIEIHQDKAGRNRAIIARSA